MHNVCSAGALFHSLLLLHSGVCPSASRFLIVSAAVFSLYRYFVMSHRRDPKKSLHSQV